MGHNHRNHGPLRPPVIAFPPPFNFSTFQPFNISTGDIHATRNQRIQRHIQGLHRLRDAGEGGLDHRADRRREEHRRRHRPARGPDDRREDRIRLHRQRRPPPGVARREQRRARPLQAGHRGHVRRPRQDPGERPRRDEAQRLRQGQAALRAAHPRRQDRGGPGGRQDKQLHRGEQGPFRIHQGRQGGGRQEDRYGFRRLQRQRRRHGHREGQHPPAHGQHAVEPPPGGGRAEKGGPAARQPERTQGGFEEQSRDIRGRQEKARKCWRKRASPFPRE